MAKESASTQVPTGKRLKWWLAAIVVVLLLGGWVGFMLLIQQRPTMVLPGGEKLTFVEVTDGTPGRAPPGPYESGFIHHRIGKRSFVDKLREWLPSGLAHWLPSTRSVPSKPVGFNSPVSKALWFSLEGTSAFGTYTFFWVDDRGYETEASPYFIRTDSEWLGFDGNVPRLQKHLHLRVRSREGERDYKSPSEPGKLGDVCAEMKFRNPLRSREPVRALTAQSLPAKTMMNGHEITLNGAVRSRIVSHPTYGMHLHVVLDRDLFQLDDWSIEDGNGNVMVPTVGWYDRGKHCLHWDRALWSDAAVWKVKFLPRRYYGPDFMEAEKFTVPRIPLHLATTATPSAWKHHDTVMGHTITVGDLRSEMSWDWVRFRVTVSPAVSRYGLLVLNVVNDKANAKGATFDSVSVTEAKVFGSTRTEFDVRCIRSEVGLEPAFTFALETAHPVEFTFRPEFEP